ncbi:ATP-binding protein [Ruminococcus champanellensis]|uniref:ATP-binding protein n=1 Tax=Ruminococcus champanellensis TaxID=1161942 RepID=UPI0023F2F607|nr:ATP-binding protein [Ruminococcus champanellensis]
MNITRGVIRKPVKVVVYGPEGIGKSTFASKFPGALFIDTEGSTVRMNVARTDPPTSLAMLTGQLEEIRSNPSLCQTLVIDTADWAERLAIQSVCDKYQKSGIEEFGYGKGYTYVYEEMGKVLNLLTDINNAGIHIVLTAHAAICKFEQPDEMGSYDRWEMKMINSSKCSVCAMIKEWADMVLFARYKTYAVAADKDGKKLKARGGERVMCTTHNPCWDAKNRFGLPDELPFEYAQIAHIFGAQPAPTAAPSATSQDKDPKTEPPAPPAAENVPESEVTIPDGIPEKLADLMRQNHVSEEEIRFAVSMKGYMPEDMPINQYDPSFIDGCLIGAWSSVFELIKSNRKVPF